MNRAIPLAVLAALLLGGCKTSYTWTSPVPKAMSTVFVPMFRNESNVTEFGAVAATQLSRELQREGSFRIASRDDAAVEVQGVVKSVISGYAGGDRHSGGRLSEYLMQATAEISVIDRRNGKVLIDNRRYRAETTFVMNQDRLTGERNASGRLAEDLARQVVDDMTSIRW